MNPTAGIFSDDILQQADETRQAEERYSNAFYSWANGVATLKPGLFWREIRRLRSIWEERRRHGRAPDDAADEYLRQAQCESEERFAEAVHFAVSYRRCSAALSKACGKVLEGWERGDDSFGDLMDSLPLAGRDVFKRIKKGEFFVEDENEDEVVNLEDLEAAVHSAAPKVADLILNGENYWASNLEEKARERMKIVLCSRG